MTNTLKCSRLTLPAPINAFLFRLLAAHSVVPRYHGAVLR